MQEMYMQKIWVFHVQMYVVNAMELAVSMRHMLTWITLKMNKLKYEIIYLCFLCINVE